MLSAIPSLLCACRKQHMEDVCCVSVQLLVHLGIFVPFSSLVHQMTIVPNFLIFIRNQIPGVIKMG